MPVIQFIRLLLWSSFVVDIVKATGTITIQRNSLYETLDSKWKYESETLDLLNSHWQTDQNSSNQFIIAN